MKNALLAICFILIGNVAIAQKKKSTAKSKTAAPKAVILAKDESNNLQAEYLNQKIYIYLTNGAKKDTLFTRKTEVAVQADNFKMNEIKCGNKNLYMFAWEETLNKKSELITENGKVNGTDIWDLENKKNVLSNRQKVSNYEEKRYLSRHKDASETISKKINEGRLFTLLTNGDVTLTGKNGSDKYTYNAEENEFKLVKPTPKKTTPAKRRR